MKRIKVISLLLVLSMVSVIFFGCSNGNNKDVMGKKDNEDNNTSESNTSDKPNPSTIEATEDSVTYLLEGDNLTLTYWHSLRAPDYQASHDDNIVWQAIEENTGVDIKWVHPATGTESEQLNLLVAGGDLPDILQIDGHYDTAGGSAAGVDEGIFFDLTENIAKYAPDYLNVITSSDLCYQMATTPEGLITHFSQIKQTAPAFSRVTLRKDIQDEIDWGDKMPVTMEDYTELFKAMKEAGYYGYAPASNGRDDQFLFPYGINGSFYLDEDGKVDYGMYDDGYKEYLKLMASWYKEGYIHPDFTGDIRRPAMFDTKEIGLLINPSDISYNNAKLAGYEIHIVNYPRLHEGQEMRFEYTTWDPVPADGIRTVISSDCKDVETAMKFLNYGYTEEGASLYNWGIEGVSYTVDSDGGRTFTDATKGTEDMPSDPAQYIYKLHFGPKFAEPDISCNPGTIGDPVALELRVLHSDDKTVNSSGVIFATLTAEQSTDRANIMKDINTYVDEMTLKFIFGELDIDDNWDEYISTLKGLNIEEAISITQEAVDTFNEKEIPTEWLAK